METGGVRQVLADALSARPYSHSQGVEPGVAAVICVEDDLSFLPDTLAAVLRQTTLPGVIVVADCTGGTAQPVQTSFEVIAASHEPLERVPEPMNVSVRLVRAQGARSFGDAVRRALAYAHLDASTRALWVLHDDSRPADERCLERLVEAMRNTPGASLLGAKQLDWSGENLHGVGAYASGHGINTLVVDGEPDQEQYDGRADVFAVSLAGALIPVETLAATSGVTAWLGTFAEGADLCRRICRGGGRVVVVPGARVAHRRARYEGLRTRAGRPVDADDAVNPAMRVMDAWQRYRYTDIPMAMWPLTWLWSLVASLAGALALLVGKQPYEAWCRLCMPWRALAGIPGSGKARRAVARGNAASRAQMAMLTAGRDQIARWRERRRALLDQRGTVLLGPLVRAHLRGRLLRRWLLAVLMAAVAFGTVVALDWTLFRSALSGGSLVSDRWWPTDATLGQVAQAATTQWLWGVGTGVSVPPAPWLWVLLIASLLTGGHVAAATSLILFVAAPVSALSFWALAGVFTRSDAVRVTCGLLWAASGMAAGLTTDVDLPMLTVMMFLPAAFAFTFRAVGRYRTEDPVRPRPSVQAAAAASLCFMPVVAAEPQLLLPLVVIFVVFLLFVPRHRAMLLLMPVPAALLVAPTLANAVRRFGSGEWRQLFGDMTVPSVASNGEPDSLNLYGVTARAFGFDTLAQPFGMVTMAVLAVIVVLAVVALMLPSVLRISRMMWVVIVAGGALSLVSSRVAIAVGVDGAIAGSVLPGLSLALMGAISCVCLTAGGAVTPFAEIAARAGRPEAADGTGKRRRGRPSDRRSRTMFRIGRIAMCVVLLAGTVAWSGLAAAHHPAGGASVTSSGLPMVAMDALQRDPDQRVLAVYADSANEVDYAVMHTSRGDLIDSSPAWRARQASGQGSEEDAKLGDVAARLLSNEDGEAVDQLVSLGFGGIYVVAGGSGSDRLMTNITASEGTQSVVASSEGTYYRLVAAEGNTVSVDTAWQRRMQRSPWRTAWLSCLGIVVILYMLVAVPRRHRTPLREDGHDDEERKEA
ncbi:glycosyltransferase family 2 protein [Bifidobacterium saguinibicoloris]|uniref:glycosyltransferase family 2 protein n=1 Tax=Bifidobacterium saguinibicoloris TaxID=2834433 RepID=UPI001C598961|nr:glycosyltransferase [Bifidobacterium saguinibicoloris]MBW3080355.1 glycosyltransferase [Bifidobacterium saguinibicoloris]